MCHEARELLVARMWNLVGSLNPTQNISDKLCGFAAGRNPPEHWSTTLLDSPRPGPLSSEVVEACEAVLEGLPEPALAG